MINHNNNMGKRQRLQNAVNGKKDESNSKKRKTEVVLEPVTISDAPVERQTKWTNKQRVLIFSSRGISHRTRHLMLDLRRLLPQARAEPKMDRKDKLMVINEICEMKNCNKCLYFEGKKKKDVYLWASNCPMGPCAKFLVENVHTMSELKLTGNCLRGSRPLLSFDKAFDSQPHWKLLKELFIQLFGIPFCHPKSQPFTDHVFSFSIEQERVWFRNYQILDEDASLAEIGPRMVLNPIAVFAGSFGGATLYQNPHYVSPNYIRSAIRRHKAARYNNKVDAMVKHKETKPKTSYDLDPTDEIFQTDPDPQPQPQTDSDVVKKKKASKSK